MSKSIMKITGSDLLLWGGFFALGWVLCAGTANFWSTYFELQKYRAQAKWYEAQIKALGQGIEPQAAYYAKGVR